MILKFTTKRDINGNRYTLEIDTENKTYNRSYNTSFDYADFVEISKKDREKLIDSLENNGFVEV